MENKNLKAVRVVTNNDSYIVRSERQWAINTVFSRVCCLSKRNEGLNYIKSILNLTAFLSSELASIYFYM